jgi:hypothetical protein
MTVVTYEGVVEKGKIRLKAGVKLPENAKVYVVVADLQLDEKKAIRMLTPRLANRKQAADFKMTMTKVKPNAKI